MMDFPLDLFVLTADADQLAAVRTLLEARTASLGIRPCRFDVRKHPQRDPGCVGNGVELLATLKSQVRHGLMILDWEGSGREDVTAVESSYRSDSEAKYVAFYFGTPGTFERLVYTIAETIPGLEGMKLVSQRGKSFTFTTGM